MRQTTAQRVAQHDERLIDAGGALLRVRLTPEANAALEAITRTTGETRTAAVNRILTTSGKIPTK